MSKIEGYSRLRKDLLKRLNVTAQRLSQLTQRKRNELPMTAAEATCLVAQDSGVRLDRYLKRDDLEHIRDIMGRMPSGAAVATRPVVVRKRNDNRRRRLSYIARYPTQSPVFQRLLDEINRTYTHGCYTSCFVMCRKALEYLLVEHIIRKKYPSSTQEHKGIYFDINQGRRHDFSVLIKNLRNKAPDFGPEKKLVERVCLKSDQFRDDANNMAHSVYHFATKSELDEKRIQDILDLIADLETKIASGSTH